ncbi:MAG: hypothetical protein M0010_19225 [Actinomycetota bacterium]|nr:hypothetical protein [Actinomycetota bacterium]
MTDVRSEHGHRTVRPVPALEREPRAVDPLAVRGTINLVGGEAGQALAASQGRALSALLASLGETKVRQGEEVSP